jgi:hypothetical protein
MNRQALDAGGAKDGENEGAVRPRHHKMLAFGCERESAGHGAEGSLVTNTGARARTDGPRRRRRLGINIEEYGTCPNGGVRMEATGIENNKRTWCSRISCKACRHVKLNTDKTLLL